MAVTTSELRNKIGGNRLDDYLYDQSAEQTVEQVAQLCIDTAIVIIKSLCGRYGQKYDDTNDIQHEATLYWAISEVYQYSNTPLTGEDERDIAKLLIDNLFNVDSYNTNDSSSGSSDNIVSYPSVSIVQSKGARATDDINIVASTTEYIQLISSVITSNKIEITFNEPIKAITDFTGIKVLIDNTEVAITSLVNNTSNSIILGTFAGVLATDILVLEIESDCKIEAVNGNKLKVNKYDVTNSI